jgi:hypothetical protein
MSAVITGSQNGTVGLINTGTAVASTSGTSIDFTGLPAGVKRITVMFAGVSTNGTSNYQLQVGSGSVTTSGYLGANSQLATSSLSTSNATSGFVFINGSGAGNVFHGNLYLTLLSSNTWTMNGMVGESDTTRMQVVAGSIALSGTLDRVRITTVNGTDTFDAGSINILYE